MTEVETGHRPTAPEARDAGSADRPSPRQRLGATVAAALVLVVVGAILLLGRIPLPGFPDLAAAPDESIPGTVAYVTADRGRACVRLIDASGAGQARELTCRPWIDGLAFTPDGNPVLLRYGELGLEALVLDPADGSVVRRATPDRELGPEGLLDRLRSFEGRRLELDEDGRGGATIRVAGDGSTTLLSVEGPRDYRFESAQWSADGRWVLVVDSRGRLLIVGATGRPAARLLVDSGTAAHAPPAWRIPGETSGTLDLGAG